MSAAQQLERELDIIAAVADAALAAAYPGVQIQAPSHRGAPWFVAQMIKKDESTMSMAQGSDPNLAKALEQMTEQANRIRATP